MKVTTENVPPLLPGSFYRKLGMVCDYPEQKITWKELGGRVSDMLILPSDHIACRIDECDDAKWIDPRKTTNPRYFGTEQYGKTYTLDHLGQHT